MSGGGQELSSGESKDHWPLTRQRPRGSAKDRLSSDKARPFDPVGEKKRKTVEHEDHYGSHQEGASPYNTTM
jgi:hypothetical protein